MQALPKTPAGFEPQRDFGDQMKRLALLAFTLLLVASAHAELKFTSIDSPVTTARGINNHGQIVGAYRIATPAMPC